MQNKRIVVLVVLIVAAALLFGYLIGRAPSLTASAVATSAKPAPKPSANSGSATRAPTKLLSAAATNTKPTTSADASTAPTLKDIYADLKRRADANDVDAASELYRDLRRCQMQQELSRSLPNWVRNELNRDTSGDSDEQLKSHERYLESMQHEIDFVQRNAAFCDGADPGMLQQFVPSSLKAAQLGDLKALRCYLGGAISFSPGLLDHPEWLTDFKQNAASLADYGMKHGDWGVVALYGHAYQGYFSSSLFGQTVQPDPVQAYQYMKLQQIAATGDFVKKITNQTDAAATDLTPDQIAQGDAWAQDMYDRYFNGTASNELSNGVNTCGGFDED